MPFGFLYSLLWKKNEKILKVILFGCIFSFCIEALQIFSFRITDINDLLMNSIGFLLGYIIFIVVNKFSPKFVSYNRIISKTECLFFKIEDLIYVFLSAIIYFLV